MSLLWINNISVSFRRAAAAWTARRSRWKRVNESGFWDEMARASPSLMKLLHKDIVPDTGEIVCAGEVCVALMPQDIENLPGTVYDVVASGGQKHLDLLREYHDLSMQMAKSDDQILLNKIEQVQHQLEAAGAWQYFQKVEAVISRTSLNERAEFRFLSAGLKRRVLLARALVSRA